VPTALDHVVRALGRAGVEVVFGVDVPLPGAAAREDGAARLVGLRQGRTAVHAADGRARSTGRVGVATVTTGPQAATVAGAVTEAWTAGSPLLVVAVAGAAGADLRAALAPAVVVTTGADLGDAPARALALARAASRPVLLEVSEEQLDATDAADVPPAADAPGYAETPDVDAAVPLLLAAERPLVWLGGGALRAGAGPTVAALAERLGAPVLTSAAARGMLAGHALLVGLPVHLPEARDLWKRADLVVAVGTDLDRADALDRRVPQPAGLVVVDDHAATGHLRADAVVVADAVLGCEELLEGLDDAGHAAPGTGYASPACELPGFATAWYGDLPATRAAAVRRLRAEHPRWLGFLDAVARAVPPQATVVTDRCAPGDWLATLHDVPAPRRLQQPTGWGTPGYALPAGIGVAADGTPTVAVTDAGGLLLACAELEVLRRERLPLTLVVVDDDRDGPDLAALVAAFGVRCTVVDGSDDVLGAELAAQVADPAPTVLVARAPTGG
jgi:thiamine pyrophosphate-dependent acetolactate synthase large subunit-like protein